MMEESDQASGGAQPRRGAMKPTRAWYLLAALLIVAAGGAFATAVTAANREIARRIPQMHRMIAPGEASFEFEEAGSYLVYYEWRSEVDGERFETEAEPPDMTLEVTGPDGEAVELDRVEQYGTYTRQPYMGTGVWRIPVEQPGTYTLVADYLEDAKGERIVLAIGRFDIEAVMTRTLGIGGAAGLAAMLLVGGLVVAVLTFTARLRAETRHEPAS
jgi:hypothetical protein